MSLLKNIINRFFKSEEDQKRLYKVVIPSFFIHAITGILVLALIFILTRSLGSRQYGIYTYSFSIVFIVVNLATNGLCLMAVKEIPSLLAKGKKGLWKGFHIWSVKLILLGCSLFAFLVGAFIIITTYYMHIIKESDYTKTILLALLSAPLFGLMNFYSSSLRGQYKIVLSLIPENIVKPFFFLIALCSCVAFSHSLNLNNAVFVNLFSFVAAALFAIFVFYKTTAFKGIRAEYDTKAWKMSLQAFFLLTVITSINSKLDILMLGYLKNSSQVGIYNAADRVAASLMIFLAIMNQVSAASISRMHTLAEKQKLQDLVTKTSRYVMLLSLPFYAVIVIFSKWIMSYFGPDFALGQTALVIIATGQIINIAFGPVGNFSLMTGNQRFNIIFSAINIFINIGLNLILTPTLGLNGTAIATATALIAWNTGMFISIRKKTGISTWILG